ncbi:single-stranded-DNA-specific exonuclease RecJ [Kiloniella laminariae]|uniref:single-stranded-DNA-specific exonuclease RecJ n=1 Tax=Kiloniella laminariae TaxID=454162 RepID=UPI0003614862|nr:single-stranded-DNA-specific exonuclease RecJ [Kiloniella laminariae]
MKKPAEDRVVFLGVENSVTGKRWEDRLLDSRTALALSQRLGLPEIIGRILAARGVGLDTAEAYLKPTLRDWLPNPSDLKGMDAATGRILQAIEARESIAVFGDYDVDGATSSALLLRYFAQLGLELKVHIPDRVTEGYGPNLPALLKLQKEGCSLVITVDCGTSAFEPLEGAKEAGLDIIVIDHHEAEANLPPAVAVVNPNRQDESREFTSLAAVGVVFLVLVALNRQLREVSWFTRQGVREPNLMNLLDLVALGTVCDVVPLSGLNRAYVSQGVKVLAKRNNPGIVALSDAAKLSERPDSGHLGFTLGPRVNAGGRVGQSWLGARLLSTNRLDEAEAIARQLEELNSERRQIEAEVLDQALGQAAELSEGTGCVLVAGEGWHPGVIGIVASRLKDRYNAPAFVIAFDDHGVGKGSGRSVPGVDLGAAVIAARQAGLLENGGGHAMAAGLTVTRERYQDLCVFLHERLSRELADISFVPSVGIDGALHPGGANGDLVELLDSCGPYGVGNAQPRFVLPQVRILRPAIVGDSHVRCILSGADGRTIKGIAFRCLDNDLGQFLLNSGGLPVHVCGKLKKDSWSGPDAVQIIIEDAASATG